LDFDVEKKPGHPLFNIHGLLGYEMRENYKTISKKNWKYPFPGDSIMEYAIIVTNQKDNNNDDSKKNGSIMFFFSNVYNVFGTCHKIKHNENYMKKEEKNIIMKTNP